MIILPIETDVVNFTEYILRDEDGDYDPSLFVAIYRCLSQSSDLQNEQIVNISNISAEKLKKYGETVFFLGHEEEEVAAIGIDKPIFAGQIKSYILKAFSKEKSETIRNIKQAVVLCCYSEKDAVDPIADPTKKVSVSGEIRGAFAEAAHGIIIPQVLGFPSVSVTHPDPHCPMVQVAQRFVSQYGKLAEIALPETDERQVYGIIDQMLSRANTIDQMGEANPEEKISLLKEASMRIGPIMVASFDKIIRLSYALGYLIPECLIGPDHTGRMVKGNISLATTLQNPQLIELKEKLNNIVRLEKRLNVDGGKNNEEGCASLLEQITNLKQEIKRNFENIDISQLPLLPPPYVLPSTKTVSTPTTTTTITTGTMPSWITLHKSKVPTTLLLEATLAEPTLANPEPKPNLVE